MPAVGQTMQFGDNYLNDGHLPPKIPKQTAATASISCHIGRSRCPLKCQTGQPPTSWSSATVASCAAIVTSRVTWVWQARWQHQTTVVALIIAMPACDSPHRADAHGGLRPRYVDGGRVRLWTQIRKNCSDLRTDADGSPPKIRRCGLTRIIYSSSALGKLTC